MVPARRSLRVKLDALKDPEPIPRYIGATTNAMPTVASSYTSTMMLRSAMRERAAAPVPAPAPGD